MYDIYLSSGCSRLIDVSHQAAEAPVLADSALHARILGQTKPGFLGLNLPANTAAELLEELLLAGGQGLVVPSAYRQPKVTLEMAYPIAKQAIAQKQETHSNYKFEPVKFLREAAMWWEFAAISEELIQQSHIPGAIHVCVDKLDGHVWTPQEQVRLYGEEYYLESAMTLDPMQVLHLLSDELGLEWSIDDKNKNQTCLRGPALVVGAVKHAFPPIIEKAFGFRPNVHVWFRMTPYKNGYNSASLLMLKAVTIMLRHDSADAVLVFDAGTLVTVLQRSSGQLVLNEEWGRWTETELTEAMLSYRMYKLPQPTLT